MHRLILLALLATIAIPTLALDTGDYGGTMGIYFSDTVFSDETMNLITTPTMIFDAYIVMTDAQVDNVWAYEVGLTITAPDFFILTASGPNGWLNYGTSYDHMVWFSEPVPVDDNGAVVLSTLQCLYPGIDQVDFIMGGSSLESIPGWDGPVITAYPDIEVLLVCHLSSGAIGYPDAVAWLNRQVVAVEPASWSQIKNMF